MTNCRTRCCCNIATVVVMIYKHTSKNPTAMLRLRSIFLICAQFNTGLSAEHIADVRKYAADALSTDNVSFLQRVLFASRIPEIIVKWKRTGYYLGRSSTVDAEPHQSGFKHCMNYFCRKMSTGPLPASESSLSAFVASLAKRASVALPSGSISSRYVIITSAVAGMIQELRAYPTWNIY